MLIGRQLPAYPLYLASRTVFWLLFATVFTVTAIYRVRSAGLSPLQLVLLGTALETGSLLFQIPTGLFADVFGRRRSIVIGLVLIGAGCLLEGLLPRFPPILLAQLVWGTGYTFVDGAEQAWIADEVGETAAGRVYLRGAQAGQIGALCGAGVSVALASIRLDLPILTGGALFVLLALSMALLMPERASRSHGDSHPVAAVRETLTAGMRLVRRRRLLQLILAITVFFGVCSEGYDRLWEAHFLIDLRLPPLGRFDSVVWFGVMNAAGMLLSIVATEALRRRLDTGSQRAVTLSLLALNLLRLLTMALFALTGSFTLALAAYLGVSMARRANLPLYSAWLNQCIESRVRATLFSLSSLVDSLGQIAGGPLIGATGSAVSISAALLAATVALAPALPLLAFATRARPTAEQPFASRSIL